MALLVCQYQIINSWSWNYCKIDHWQPWFVRSPSPSSPSPFAWIKWNENGFLSGKDLWSKAFQARVNSFNWCNNTNEYFFFFNLKKNVSKNKLEINKKDKFIEVNLKLFINDVKAIRSSKDFMRAVYCNHRLLLSAA